MIRIGICEDKREILRFVENEFREYLKERNRGIEDADAYKLVCYHNPQRLLDDIQEKRMYDLLCLDIEMPELDGLELAKQIKIYTPHALILFLSAHEKYVYDTFELGTYRFIPKNQMELRLKKAFFDAIDKIEREKDEYLEYKTRTEMGKIPVKEIVSVRRESQKTIVITVDREIALRLPMKQVYESLPQKKFLWIHRGEICNIEKVTAVRNGEVTLVNGRKLQIPRGKVSEIQMIMHKYWMKKGQQ